MSKGRTVVFGAGDVGVRAKEKLEQQNMQVVAFADNNRSKWGKQLEGIPVISPENIAQADPEYVAIGVYKAVEPIRRQLCQMGIEEDKIIVPINPDRLYPNSLVQELEKEAEECLIYLIFSQPLRETLIHPGMVYEKIEINFKHNFFGFLYFIEECLRYCDTCFHENVWNEIFSFHDTDALRVTFYMLQSPDTLSNGIRTVSHEACRSKSPFLYSLLQSQSTIGFWKKRIQRPIDSELLQRLHELKEVMIRNHIPINEICIVGSTALELFGLHDHNTYDDIDIIMTERFRALYGTGLIIASEHVEVHPQNEFDISDQEIIQNPVNHFLFYGLKIVNLNVLYKKIRNGKSRDAFCARYYCSDSKIINVCSE